MKKIILSILFISFGFISFGQNLKGYNVEALLKLEAKRAFVIDLDTFYATTQLSGVDTILVTKNYLNSYQKYADTLTTDATKYDLTFKQNVLSNPVTVTGTSTDNAIARFDGTTGQIQNSGVIISDAGAIVTPSTIQASSAIFSGDINVNGSNINTTLNDFKININSTNQIYRITRANAFADAVNSAFQQFGALSINDNMILSGANGAVLNRFGLTAYKFVFGGSSYNYANLPSPVKDFNIYGTSYFSNTVEVNNTIQATTGKFTNLTDNYLPYHVSDASGLANSNVFQTSNRLRYNTTLTTFDNDNDIPNVKWVNSVATGNMPKLPVDAATTTNITLSGTQTIDGYSATAGKRILVKNQTTQSQNGVYVVAAGAWTRATDLDTWTELYKAYVAVLNGTVSSGSSYVCTIPVSGTLGTDAVTWILYNAPANILVNSPLSKSGNTISLNYDTNTLDVASGNLKVKDNIYQPKSTILTNTTATYLDADSIKLAGLITNAVPDTRTITINGTSQDLSANRTYNVGTVTSVATGLGLTGGTITNTGTLAIDTSSTVVLSRQRAANTYQTKLTNPVTGTGTTNYVSKWTGTTTQGNSSIYDNGNIGIGTTANVAKLDIFSQSNTIGLRVANSDEPVFALKTNIHTTTVGSKTFDFGLFYGTNENTAIRFYRGSSGVGGFMTFTTSNGSERVRIDDSGNVSINNTSASEKLDVNGNARFRSVGTGTMVSRLGITSDGTLTTNVPFTSGTVTSVATGLGLTGGTITSTGTVSLDTANINVLSRQRAANTYQPKGTYLTSETDPIYSVSSWFSTTNNSANWNIAYTDRNKWDGGATGLNAATGRTSLGGTTIGSNLFTSTNPSAIRFLRANADNSISWLTAAEFLTAIGAGTSSGTVSSVAMTVPTGLTVSGSPITSSGTLAVSLQSGYSIPTTTNQNNWNTAYGWGNHATAGYLTDDSNYAKLNAANIFISNQNISKTTPIFNIKSTDATARKIEFLNSSNVGVGNITSNVDGSLDIQGSTDIELNAGSGNNFRVTSSGHYAEGLENSTQTNVLGYNSVTGALSYFASPSAYTAGSGLQLSGSNQFAFNFNGLGLISGGSIVDGDLIGIYDASIGNHYKLTMGGLKTYLNIPSAYTLPLAANGTRGGIQIGYTSTANNFALQLSSEKAYTALPDATTTIKGIASFNTTNFSTSTGAVSIKSGGVTASNFNSNVISGQTDIGANIVDSDIFLISNGSVIRKTAASRLKTYIGGLTDGDKGDITVSGSGTNWNIDANTVGATELQSTTVTPGNYSAANISVDSDGRIISASNGTFPDGKIVTVALSGTNLNFTGTSGAFNGSVSLSSLDGHTMPIRSITTSTALTSTDYTVLMTSSGASISSFPAITGKIYIIANMTGTVLTIPTVWTSNSATTTNISGTAKYMIQYDGSKWWVINTN